MFLSQEQFIDWNDAIWLMKYNEQHKLLEVKQFKGFYTGYEQALA